MCDHVSGWAGVKLTGPPSSRARGEADGGVGQATVRIVQGPYNDRTVDKVPYEDICKLASSL